MRIIYIILSTYYNNLWVAFCFSDKIHEKNKLEKEILIWIGPRPPGSSILACVWQTVIELNLWAEEAFQKCISFFKSPIQLPVASLHNA